MANKLRFHPRTAEDLSSSTAYYDEISESVGGRFRPALRDRFQAIVERPESFACIHDQQWAALVYGFPYVILFIGRRENGMSPPTPWPRERRRREATTSVLD